MSNTTVTNNPLLIGQGLPPFEKITSDHVIPAMTELLQELETKLKDLETRLHQALQDNEKLQKELVISKNGVWQD